VVGRAVLDGLIGLTGIVVPYMIPLVLLLVTLEEAGLMHRIAFVVDRGFHHIGLHGGVAVPFLLGLGCNVPAISGAAKATSGRERVIASVLISFVPCSARSAIILAIAGKYLGAGGVLGIFAMIAGADRRAGPPAFPRQPRGRPGPGAGDSTLRHAHLAQTAGRDLGAYQRHPYHRDAAAGRRQRGARAAQPRRCRQRDQFRADAGHRLVAGPAAGARRAAAVRRAAQGAFAC
jgi:hypothetical protein